MLKLFAICLVVFGIWAYVSPETFGAVGDTVDAARCEAGAKAYCAKN
jgi:hypothetical protein